ncbi:LLM class flavin-dependent oxidoreductase [Nocardia vaccinii]|uniref:LLM class flavin-dependent oxidoreductase n=1 Tax=Nocardia vaccinii TaxID=1822 RepID=UPI00082E7A1D|nr:LLM class flavin-dependent oxidoreductase [Nocardia vaccinii]
MNDQPARRWGLTLPVSGKTIGQLATLTRELEELGYGELRAVEAGGFDVVSAATVTGVSTDSVPITATLSAFTRGPAVLALTAAQLSASFGSRVGFSIATSTPALVTSWNGIPYEKPFSRLRDVVRFLIAALNGEKIDRDYDTFSIRHFKLIVPPPTPPQIMVASVGELGMKLAREEADGLTVNWCTPNDLNRMKGLPEPELVTSVVSVCLHSDPKEVRRIGRAFVTDQLCAPGYRAHQIRLGRGEALEPMWTARERYGKAAAMDALPDAIFEDLLVYGTPSECRARLDEYVEVAGVRPIINILGSHRKWADTARALAG